MLSSAAPAVYIHIPSTPQRDNDRMDQQIHLHAHLIDHGRFQDHGHQERNAKPVHMVIGDHAQQENNQVHGRKQHIRRTQYTPIIFRHLSAFRFRNL